MTSQPGGGPAIPSAAALSGLASDEDQDSANPAAEDDDKDDDRFVTAGMQAPSTDEDGTPIGQADAEQDRIRASDDSDN